MMRVTTLTGFGRRTWWHPLAALHLDFINRRYYWGGRERNEGSADFERWLNVTITPGEGMTSAAIRGVRVVSSGVSTSTNYGTIVASFKATNGAVANGIAIADIYDGGTNNISRIYYATGPQFGASVRSGGVNQATWTSLGFDTTTIHCIALSWDNVGAGNAHCAIDGVAQTSDTAVTVPVGPFTHVTAGSPDGYVREVIYIDATLTAAQCAKISGDLRR